MSKHGTTLYLEDIKDSIHKIENYVNNLSFSEFEGNTLIQDAVIRNLEIIGEAAKNLPQEIINSTQNIEWKQLIGMRNKVIHEYFGIDIEILWKTIKEDIPNLKMELEVLLRELSDK